MEDEKGEEGGGRWRMRRERKEEGKWRMRRERKEEGRWCLTKLAITSSTLSCLVLYLRSSSAALQ